MAVGLLGVLELAVGVFLLVGSPTLLPATVGAIVVVFIAGVVALAAAVRIHRNGPGSPTSTPAAPIQAGRKSSTGPDTPQPTQNGVRPKPTRKPGGAPKSGPAQRSGVKKSARKT